MSEFCIFGKKAVAGMNRLSAAALGNIDKLPNIQIRF